jgi:hypothetical protein
MHQPLVPPPSLQSPGTQPRLLDGTPDGRPPPIWQHLTPGHRRQLARITAELLRRAWYGQPREGSSDDAHDAR